MSLPKNNFKATGRVVSQSASATALIDVVAGRLAEAVATQKLTLEFEVAGRTGRRSLDMRTEIKSEP